MHDYPEFNSLIVDEEGFLKGIRTVTEIQSETSKNLAFTGIAVYQPEFLSFLPSSISSVVDAWWKAIAAGHKIGIFDVSGCYWSDIGTPASYAKAVIHKLRKNGESVYIHPSVTGCNRIEMDGYVVIEKKSSLNKGLCLRNCIILPETNTPPSPPLTKERLGGVLFENCIIGPDFKIDLDESEIFSVTEGSAILIGTGGSDRNTTGLKEKITRQYSCSVSRMTLTSIGILNTRAFSSNIPSLFLNYWK